MAHIYQESRADIFAIIDGLQDEFSFDVEIDEGFFGELDEG